MPENDDVEPIAKEQNPEDKSDESAPVLPPEVKIPEAVIKHWDTNEDRKYRLDRCGIAIQVAMVLAIVGYTIVSCNQWRTLQETLKVTNTQAKATTEAANAATRANDLAAQAFDETKRSNEWAYRAWLTVKDIRDAPSVVVGSHAELVAQIENTGRSPAQNVQVNAITALAPRHWRIPERAPDVRNGEGNVTVIGPGQKRSVPFRMKAPLTPPDIDAIKNGKSRIYWFADVTYSDQFGSDRLLQFCFLYEPYEAPVPQKSGISLPTCGSHESVK